jgi:surface polysaccharide O-acyltransferase-like enzyme
MTPAAPKPAATARNAHIDALRGWSIFGVVCVHFAGSFVVTDANAWSPSFWVGLTLNQLFSFAVPLFLFLSGLLARSSTKTVSLGEYYRSRLGRIGFPYLIVSILSFFLLNHYGEWQALPNIGAKFTWLWRRLLLTGVEPTLYFIPLILQLYLLQPALAALPGWLHRAVPALKAEHHALAVSVLLLGLHLTLGFLCDRGTLNYYTWGRPNVFFWMFYFFAGLHFRGIAGLVSPAALRTFALLGLGAAALCMGWNLLQLCDPAKVGLHFELNRLDFAYARPEMMAYDLLMVAGLAAGIALGWAPRPGVAAYVGRFTLEVYLWHILVLYFGVWQFPEALAACREVPELIVLICAGAAGLIAVVTDGLQRLAAFARSHRVVLVKAA